MLHDVYSSIPLGRVVICISQNSVLGTSSAQHGIWKKILMKRPALLVSNGLFFKLVCGGPQHAQEDVSDSHNAIQKVLFNLLKKT